MDTLVALSTGLHIFIAAVITLFPSLLAGKGVDTHVYFEASAVIVTFILLGSTLEERAKANTSSSLKKLIGLQVKTAFRLLKTGEEKEIPVSEVMPGISSW